MILAQSVPITSAESSTRLSDRYVIDTQLCCTVRGTKLNQHAKSSRAQIQAGGITTPQMRGQPGTCAANTLRWIIAHGMGQKRDKTLCPCSIIPYYFPFRNAISFASCFLIYQVLFLYLVLNVDSILDFNTFKGKECSDWLRHFHDLPNFVGGVWVLVPCLFRLPALFQPLPRLPQGLTIQIFDTFRPIIYTQISAAPIKGLRMGGQISSTFVLARPMECAGGDNTRRNRCGFCCETWT